MLKCSRHPDATLKRLKKPPSTASTKIVLLPWPQGHARECDFFTYYECPVCKVHLAEVKPEAEVVHTCSCINCTTHKTPA